jgi:hypothetical protein
MAENLGCDCTRNAVQIKKYFEFGETLCPQSPPIAFLPL